MKQSMAIAMTIPIAISMASEAGTKAKGYFAASGTEGLDEQVGVVLDVVMKFFDPVADLILVEGDLVGGEVDEGGDLAAFEGFESLKPVLLYGVAFEAGVAEEGFEIDDVGAFALFPGQEGFGEELVHFGTGDFVRVVFLEESGKVTGALEGGEGLADAAASVVYLELLDELALLAVLLLDEEFEFVEEVGTRLRIQSFGTSIEAELDAFLGTEELEAFEAFSGGFPEDEGAGEFAGAAGHGIRRGPPRFFPDC